jgi:hypothetical protein
VAQPNNCGWVCIAHTWQQGGLNTVVAPPPPFSPYHTQSALFSLLTSPHPHTHPTAGPNGCWVPPSVPVQHLELCGDAWTAEVSGRRPNTCNTSPQVPPSLCPLPPHTPPPSTHTPPQQVQTGAAPRPPPPPVPVQHLSCREIHHPLSLLNFTNALPAPCPNTPLILNTKVLTAAGSPPVPVQHLELCGDISALPPPPSPLHHPHYRQSSPPNHYHHLRTPLTPLL